MKILLFRFSCLIFINNIYYKFFITNYNIYNYKYNGNDKIDKKDIIIRFYESKNNINYIIHHSKNYIF